MAGSGKNRWGSVQRLASADLGWSVFGCTVVFVGLALARWHSYLLFHSVAEVFSIAVAGGIFMVAWNSRRFINQSYFLFIGIACLFVGLIDLLHTLAYRGMGVFQQGGPNLGTQLWIAARLMQSLSFAVAPLLLRRVVKPGWMFGADLAAMGLLLWMILGPGWFPDCYVDGTGLTAFKVVTEYGICGVLLYATWDHLRNRQAFEPTVLRWLVTSLMVTIASELAFTLYTDVFGVANLVGHFLKVIAFYLVYKVFVQVALSSPYQLVFLDLKRSQEALQVERVRLESTHRELQTAFQLLAEDETAARRIQFLLLPPGRMMCRGCEFCSSVHTSAYLSGDFVDYFPISDETAGFYIADVSGHGVSSAFITLLLKSSMAHLLEEFKRGQDNRILNPAGVLTSLNQYLLEQRLGKYLTMFYAVLELNRLRLTFSNAGQFPSPILADGQGTRFLEQKAMPIGLFPQATYRTDALSIARPFMLALFSDGVLEQLPQPDLRSKQNFLLEQVASADLSLEKIENVLGLSRVVAPVDDLTVMLLKAA